MPLESAGLFDLPAMECRKLLEQCAWGRVVLSINALPAALPVNYRVVGNDVVFRTADGGKMAAALENTVVAFEIDDHDPETRTGWSVLVVGVARHLTTADDLARAEASHLDSWLPGTPPYYVAISLDRISGRRLER